VFDRSCRLPRPAIMREASLGKTRSGDYGDTNCPGDHSRCGC